jgi:hypothetical protein
MIPIYSAGRQLRKVRLIKFFSLICAAGSLWWGISLFQTYGLSPGDGGVLAPLSMRLAWGIGISLIGISFAAGMGLYGKMYVARANYDGLAQQITLETLGLFGFEQHDFPLADMIGSRYQEGWIRFGPITINLSTLTNVYAPWQSLRFAGRRLPFLLDLQGEMLEPDLVERLLIKPPQPGKAAEDNLKLL